MGLKEILGGLRKKAVYIAFAVIAVAVVVVLLWEAAVYCNIEGASIGPFGFLVNSIAVFTRNVTATISSWGYAGLFVLMVLDSSSVPIPSEMILPFAGFLVSVGQFSFWAAVAVSSVACIVGSLIDYYIGLKAAYALSQHRFFGKYIFTQNQLEIAVRWFSRYGAAVIFFSRLIPAFRTIISFPAGAVKMPLGKFLLYTTVGCVIWNSVLIYVGFWLGSQWIKVAGVSHDLIIATVVALGVAFLVFLFWRRRRKNRANSPTKSP
ncbi:MAG: DedA family protein [Candidatus Bathyarchaeota archaeon]|nr:DedA family protein [Candidatus Bathyarchaeota archaeon]